MGNYRFAVRTNTYQICSFVRRLNIAVGKNYANHAAEMEPSANRAAAISQTADILSPQWVQKFLSAAIAAGGL
jgi:2-keto-4-pentenoate hydratase/2-oxohepta-3-ene-1,7-dioic acid hydratase in catechol pathway